MFSQHIEWTFSNNPNASSQNEQAIVPEDFTAAINSQCSELISETSECTGMYWAPQKKNQIRIYAPKNEDGEFIPGGFSMTLNPWATVLSKYLYFFYSQPLGDRTNPGVVYVNGKSYNVVMKPNETYFMVELPQPEIVTSLELYVLRDKDDKSAETMAAFSKMRIADTHSNPDTKLDVARWILSYHEFQGIKNTSRDLPEITADPAEASLMAQFESSDPDVCEITDNKIYFKKEGKATIRATVRSNKIFKPSSLYDEATVTVVPNSASAVQTTDDCVEQSLIFDLRGYPVEKITSPGIYIERSGKTVRKIVIK